MRVESSKQSRAHRRLCQEYCKAYRCYCQHKSGVGTSDNTVRRMGKVVQVMVSDVLNAFVNSDLALADEVRIRDEEVDEMHNTLFRELLTYMMEDPRNITPCMHMLFIAKNLERMGDHTTAVAEQVHYVITGSLPAENRPKGDKTRARYLRSPDMGKDGNDNGKIRQVESSDG